MQKQKQDTRVDLWAAGACPSALRVQYHWSIMQGEYVPDIVFLRQSDLQEIYGTL